MAIVNHERKEVSCKVVYFGAPGCGRTQNLRSIYRNSANQTDSQNVIELASPATGNHYFEFLPVSLGQVGGYHVKLHIFTEPLEIYPSVRDVVLQGVDGCVFIVDSQFSQLEENVRCLKKAQEHLQTLGYKLESLPTIIQYNKRDLDDAVECSVLSRELNKLQVPEIEAVALEDKGTLETVHKMAQMILDEMSQGDSE